MRKGGRADKKSEQVDDICPECGDLLVTFCPSCQRYKRTEERKIRDRKFDMVMGAMVALAVFSYLVITAIDYIAGGVLSDTDRFCFVMYWAFAGAVIAIVWQIGAWWDERKKQRR